LRAVAGGYLLYYDSTTPASDPRLMKQPTRGGAPSQLGMGSGDLSIVVGNASDVYGIEFNTDSIKKVPLSGGDAMSLGIPAMNWDGLALDSNNLYVRSWMERVVMKIPLNGGGAVKLADAMASRLDVDDSHVYLGGNDFIARVPIDGGQVEPVAQGLGMLLGVVGDYVYSGSYQIGRTVWRIHK